MRRDQRLDAPVYQRRQDYQTFKAHFSETYLFQTAQQLLDPDRAIRPGVAVPAF